MAKQFAKEKVTKETIAERDNYLEQWKEKIEKLKECGKEMKFKYGHWLDISRGRSEHFIIVRIKK